MGIDRRGGTATAPSPSDYANGIRDNSDLTPESEDDDTERSSSVVKSGWAAAKAKIKETKTNSFADDWNPPAGVSLLKFLQDEPFAVVGQHWVDEIYRAKAGRASFNCRENDCPLCSRGHKPRALVYFNVVPIQVNGESLPAEVVALKSGPLLEELIEEESDGRGGPLSRHYWELKKWEDKSGGRTKVKYSFTVLKARDLAEDLQLDPDAIAASYSGLDCFGPETITIPPREELQAVVDEWLSTD